VFLDRVNQLTHPSLEKHLHRRISRSKALGLLSNSMQLRCFTLTFDNEACYQLGKHFFTNLIIECDKSCGQPEIYATLMIENGVTQTIHFKMLSLLNLSWLCETALALRECDIAPYVVLDTLNMLIDDGQSDYETIANRNHFKKIKMVEAVQRRLREKTIQKQ
jgi:hypothetical protein